MRGAQSKRGPTHFKTMIQLEVPQGRSGKHKLIVTTILKDLDRLKAGAAIKVPLTDLADSKENIRSALNRATRKAGRKVATASDGSFLYVWNVTDYRSTRAFPSVIRPEPRAVSCANFETVYKRTDTRLAAVQDCRVIKGLLCWLVHPFSLIPQTRKSSEDIEQHGNRTACLGR